jgi:hypothetical protein
MHSELGTGLGVSGTATATVHCHDDGRRRPRRRRHSPLELRAPSSSLFLEFLEWLEEWLECLAAAAAASACKYAGLEVIANRGRAGGRLGGVAGAFPSFSFRFRWPLLAAAGTTGE